MRTQLSRFPREHSMRTLHTADFRENKAWGLSALKLFSGHVVLSWIKQAVACCDKSVTGDKTFFSTLFSINFSACFRVLHTLMWQAFYNTAFQLVAYSSRFDPFPFQVQGL